MHTSDQPIPHNREDTAIKQFIGIGDRACFSISPDGGKVLIRKYGLGTEIGRNDFKVSTWNPTTGESETIYLEPMRTRSRKIHLNYVYTIALSPDRNRFISGHATGGLCMWDLASRIEVDEFPYQPDIGAVGSVLYSPSADLVAAGGSEGIAIIKCATGEISCEFPGFIEKSRQMVFSLDGRFLLCGDFEGPMRLLDVFSGSTVVTFNTILVAEGVALSADLQLALAGRSGGTVHLCDVDDGSEVISWSQDDTDQPLAEIYSFGPGRQRKEHIVEISKDVSVDISPDSRFALTGSRIGLMRMWDLTSRREKCRFERFGAELAMVRFFPDGNRLISGYSDGSVSVWPVPS